MAKLKYDEVLCPACAEAIKAAAKKCKHCGHEITDADIQDRLKASQNSAGAAVGGGCVVLVVLGLIVAMCSGGSDGGGTDSEGAKKAAADKQAGFHCLSAWDGSHSGFVEKVKARLRDPNSFEHDETRVGPNKDGTHTIAMRYRARNGFGGMNVGYAIGTFDHESCEASDPVMD